MDIYRSHAHTNSMAYEPPRSSRFRFLLWWTKINRRRCVKTETCHQPLFVESPCGMDCLPQCTEPIRFQNQSVLAPIADFESSCEFLAATRAEGFQHHVGCHASRPNFSRSNDHNTKHTRTLQNVQYRGGGDQPNTPWQKTITRIYPNGHGSLATSFFEALVTAMFLLEQNETTRGNAP